MSVTVKMAWHAEKLAEKAREAGLDALYRGGERILEEATRIVPKQEGTLMGDSEVTMDRPEGKVYVGFGLGPAAAYAVVQHENTDYKHGQGRQANYLKQPLDERGDEVIQYVADAIEREMR